MNNASSALDVLRSAGMRVKNRPDKHYIGKTIDHDFLTFISFDKGEPMVHLDSEKAIPKKNTYFFDQLFYAYMERSGFFISPIELGDSGGYRLSHTDVEKIVLESIRMMRAHGNLKISFVPRSAEDDNCPF